MEKNDHTHSDYMTPGQSPLPLIVVFDSDKNNSPAKELIPNPRDCYDNQDDHATVLHSVSLNGLLWKRKCLYQAGLKVFLHCISGGMSCMPTHLSHTQQCTDVTGIFCGGKLIFNTYAKQVMGEKSCKMGHSKPPDFNMCNYIMCMRRYILCK